MIQLLTSSANRRSARSHTPVIPRHPHSHNRQNKTTGKEMPEQAGHYRRSMVGQFWKSIDTCSPHRPSRADSSPTGASKRFRKSATSSRPSCPIRTRHDPRQPTPMRDGFPLAFRSRRAYISSSVGERLMTASTIPRTLSANEAACVTGVPLRQVHRIIDAGLLGNAAARREGSRAVHCDALVSLKCGAACKIDPLREESASKIDPPSR